MRLFQVRIEVWHFRGPRPAVVFALVSAAASLTSLSAFGLGNDLPTRVGAPLRESLGQVGELTCDPKAYGTRVKELKGCGKCKEVVSETKKDLLKAADVAGVADSGISGAFGGVARGLVGGLGGRQREDEMAGSDATSGARGSMSSRASNASALQARLEKCKKDVKDNCKSLAEADVEQADKLNRACTEGATSADRFASEQKKGGMDMGDLSKMMQAAAGALGPLSQLAQQQKQDGSSGSSPSEPSALSGGATSPTPDSLNDSGKIEKSSTGDASGSSKDNGQKIGFGLGNGTKIGGVDAASAAASGQGSPGSGSSSGYAANGLGSGAGANGAGASVPSSGGGGGGGALSSSGASRPGEGVAAGAGSGTAGSEGAGAGEFNLGGGKSIVGLKPSKGDTNDVADGFVPLSDAHTKLDDMGNRDPASEAKAAEDSLGRDSDSIFLRVRQKYATLKGAGKI